MKTATWVVVLIATSALLAVGESKLIWGYGIQRPSIASSLRGADEVLGISSLPPGSTPQMSTDWATLLEARRRCEPPSNECLEGSLLIALDGRDARAGEVRNHLLRDAWSKESRERPLPPSKDPRYQQSAHPVAGLGIHLRQRGEEYVALAYRTSEVANDRYIYSEALYRLHGGSLEPVRLERFSYEIAGLEAMDWRVLWLLNLASLAAAVTIAAFIKKRIRRPPFRAVGQPS
jgi:hypothetical protein